MDTPGRTHHCRVGRGWRPKEWDPPAPGPGGHSATSTVINNYYYLNNSTSPSINKLGITTSRQKNKETENAAVPGTSQLDERNNIHR